MNLTSIIPLLDSFPGQRQLLPQRLVSCPGVCGNLCFKASCDRAPAGASCSPRRRPVTVLHTHAQLPGHSCRPGLCCAQIVLYSQTFYMYAFFLFRSFFLFLYIYTLYVYMCIMCVGAVHKLTVVSSLTFRRLTCPVRGPCASPFRLFPMFSIQNCATVKLCGFLFLFLTLKVYPETSYLYRLHERLCHSYCISYWLYTVYWLCPAALMT